MSVSFLSDQSKLIYPTVRIDSISIHTERGRDGIHKLGALIQIGQHSCHKKIKDKVLTGREKKKIYFWRCRGRRRRRKRWKWIGRKSPLLIGWTIAWDARRQIANRERGRTTTIDLHIHTWRRNPTESPRRCCRSLETRDRMTKMLIHIKKGRSASIIPRKNQR